MRTPLRIIALATLILAAMTVGQAQVPITLNNGWNWISYPYSEPMTIEEALSGFTPANGDIINSQTEGSATYLNGRWRGSLTTLVPGKGYMYNSADGTTRSFVFGGAANDPSALPEEALSGEFTVASNGTKVRFSPGNLQCRVNPSQESQITVGMGTVGFNYTPYHTLWNYSLCQMIYKANELHDAGISAGPITGLSFESYSTNHYLRDNIEIWMANTSLTEMSNMSVSTSGMKKVFFGSVTQQTGWTEIGFTSSPFVWDGASNVLVTVMMNHGSWNSSTSWQCSETDFTCSGYEFNDNAAYDPSLNTYTLRLSNNRPNTRFNGKGGATWRFAEQQWDIMGASNANVSSSYTSWFDLFGWGTSGHPHGANCFQPWSTSSINSDYYAYGDVSYNLFDQTGEADWGCNAISNGGDKPNQWRMLTKEEWTYLLNTRTTSSGKRYAKARVSGKNGLILLPDGWKTSYYSLSNTNSGSAAFTSNTITATQWPTLEQHGAVFLPMGGYRNGTTVNSVGELCFYWSSSCNGSGTTYSVGILDSSVNSSYNDNPRFGNAVRLVCQSNPRIRTIGVSEVTTSGATVSAEVDFTGTVQTRGVCWNTTGGPTVNDNYYYAGTGKGSYTAQMRGLQPNTTYHVRAYAKIGNDYRYGNTLTFITADDCVNGHAYVDLGLPSGLLWATCNVGADNPEDYGGYFAWGETQPKDYYDWSTYQYCNGSNSTMTKYCTNADYGNNGFVDNQTTLFPEDDAATTNWGSDWRMPTKEEWQELYNNTTWTWTTQNGVNGRLFTAANGNSLFLPAAGSRWDGELDYAGSYGYYWSSSLYTDRPGSAWYLDVNSGDTYVGNNYRYVGFSVRPVLEN
ncbi:MAG: hypothetical protein IJQ83_00515 [Bacteroidales bacterium]|nr:hypothetical protein [Bacteroidales bacterium]